MSKEKEVLQGAPSARDPDADLCDLCGMTRAFHPTKKRWRQRSPYAQLGHVFVETAVQGVEK